MTKDKEESTTTAQSASIVGSIMSLYATMVHGQIVCNDRLSHADKVAAILCAADVLNKAHAVAITKLCEIENVSPAWVVGNERAVQTAEMYAATMIGSME